MSSLSQHFRKAAKFHERLATINSKMAKAHAGKAAFHAAAEEKAADSHHKAAAAFHKAMAGHHEDLQELDEAYSQHLRGVADGVGSDYKADDTSDLVKLLATGSGSDGLPLEFRHLVSSIEPSEVKIAGVELVPRPGESIGKADLPADFAALVGSRDQD
jgi:hypothetical protein